MKKIFVKWEGYFVKDGSFEVRVFDDLYLYTDFIQRDNPYHTGCVEMIDKAEYDKVINDNFEKVFGA